MEEIWKEIPKFENKYFVSNIGEIKNSNGHILNGMRSRSQPYKKYALSNGDGTYSYLLGHRIVALTFLENPNNYPVVHHKDGNKLNNNVINLEWCTHKYNTQEMVKAGKHYQFKKGNENPSAKLTDHQVKGIFKLREINWSLTEIADLLNCSRSHISEILNGKSRVQN